uniref:WGS project CBMI000000000 data, contig CS3069_c001293 n=1 Tax=Fusarium clavum TaxID=2594811 RepID=A0A090MFQ9_9HYPO|nr:unnamed protein product [Fusarium clavum]
MDLLLQSVLLDPGPSLPEPGRADVLGTTRDMRNPHYLANYLAGHSCSLPGSGTERMETIDHNDSDHMGSIHLRTSAASLGRCSSLPSSDIHVDDCESQPRDACAPITSLVIPEMQNRKFLTDVECYTLELNSKRILNLDHSKTESTKLGCKRLQTPFKPFNGTRISPPFQPPTGDDESFPRMMSQPETRPISQDQLAAEVRGIYAGLVPVETKYIEVDNTDTANNNSKIDSKLNNEQWQALIALHRTLLHEHHDFFLASQYPSASPALRRLATKSTMPARMWRHGIHSFLELLRHSPHLAILARPNALQQLRYYTKHVLFSPQGSNVIMSLFNPNLNGKPPWISTGSTTLYDAQTEHSIHPALDPGELMMLLSKERIIDNHRGIDRQLNDLHTPPKVDLIGLPCKFSVGLAVQPAPRLAF